MEIAQPSSARPVLAQLQAVRLRITPTRVAVLQAFKDAPTRWICAEHLYRELFVHGVSISMSTLYRLIHEMADRGLLLRQVDENGKRFYRVPTGGTTELLRVECSVTGESFTFADRGLREQLACLLRGRGLRLTEADITVRVQCLRQDSMSGGVRGAPRSILKPAAQQ